MEGIAGSGVASVRLAAKKVGSLNHSLVLHSPPSAGESSNMSQAVAVTMSKTVPHITKAKTKSFQVAGGFSGGRLVERNGWRLRIL
jgi:hypothetical protein